MKKDRTMKKSTFVNGAFITTLGIVIAKIFGILYVIPFHAVIGEKGGALYGYAYTVYLVFMSLSTAGIPLAISKIVSEYQTLGYYGAKKRAFIIGKRIALLLGVTSSLILLIIAPLLAKWILGDLTGGNKISDVTFVIRVISTAVLIVPVLSVYRGYFEGHRFMSPPSISQIVEQIIRILVIVVGSYLMLKVFKLSLTSAVGVAVFGATVGALGAYVYLVNKKLRNKQKFNEKIRAVNEPIITNKEILKKIVIYAVPFIMIDIFKSLYSYVDIVTVVKGLVKYADFSIGDAEIVMSILSTWGAKFNMILFSVSTGVIVSLIPNLTKSVVDNDQKSINKKISQSLSIILFLTVPMTIGLSFLSDAVWTLFYGSSKYGASVLSYSIFVGFFAGLFTPIVSIVQVLKDYKTVFISLLVGLILKILLNTKLIVAFYKMGVPAFFGVSTASIVAYLVAFIICLVSLRIKYNVEYEQLVKNFVDILCGSMVMTIILFLLRSIIPVFSDCRIMNLFIILVYSISGVIAYLIFAYRTKTIQNIFGNKIGRCLKKRK